MPVVSILSLIAAGQLPEPSSTSATYASFLDTPGVQEFAAHLAAPAVPAAPQAAATVASTAVVAVPEPATAVLLAAGVAMLGILSLTRRRPPEY